MEHSFNLILYLEFFENINRALKQVKVTLCRSDVFNHWKKTFGSFEFKIWWIKRIQLGAYWEKMH